MFDKEKCKEALPAELLNRLEAKFGNINWPLLWQFILHRGPGAARALELMLNMLGVP